MIQRIKLDVKDPDALGSLDLPRSVSRRLFEFGEYACLELEVETKTGDILKARFVPLKERGGG